MQLDEHGRQDAMFMSEAPQIALHQPPASANGEKALKASGRGEIMVA